MTLPLNLDLLDSGPDHESYITDLADAMRHEYEAIHKAGFELQLDCPDLAMSRHTGFQNLSDAEFLGMIEINVEAINSATANIPAENIRMHICWGNYEGPHDHNVPLQKIINTILKARPATVLFEAANPRHEHEWTVWREARLPEDKILAPGLIDTCSNYLARIIHEIDQSFRIPFVRREFRSIGNTVCIPLPHEIPYEQRVW